MLSRIRDHHDREIISQIRGANVYGQNDEELGSVEDAIVNPESGELRYLIVDAGWLHTRRFLVPADQVNAYRGNDDLYVNLSRQQVESLPAFDDACLSSEDAFTNYEHEYRRAWQPRGNVTEIRPSSRLLRLRDRVRESYLETRNRAARTQAGPYPVASYSGALVHPTGVYGVYSDRKDVESTVATLKAEISPAVTFPSFFLIHR
jgi:sporulation protein YlmC with PRC-barrel domain